MSLDRLLAERTGNMKASAIRETLKVVSQPGMISLAGGIPAPESFPMDIFKELSDLVQQKYSWRALQYGPTEGFMPLREALAGLCAERDVAATPEQVIITSGSQESLDALGKIMIGKGEAIAVEAPTYVGAISAFNAYQPRYISIETDGDGVIPDALEAILKRDKVKFVYLIPTFQNPSGRTIPLERRKKIADIAVKYDALIIEDDPYGSLRYRGEPVTLLKTMAPDHVVYLSTLSKIFAPGLRLGFCVAPPLIQRWMVLAKQGIDLHTSSYDQALAGEYIAGGYLKRQIPKIVSLYAPKQQAMLEGLDKYFPNSFTWSRPDGGMFVWAEGPEGINTTDLYTVAVSRKVAFLPGEYFFTDGVTGKNTMRLNFTMSDGPTLDRGLRILGEVLSEAVANHSGRRAAGA